MSKVPEAVVVRRWSSVTRTRPTTTARPTTNDQRLLPSRDPAGFALVIVLLALTMMTTIGVVAVLTTSAESRIAANFRGAEQALYAADAGAERAIDDLRTIDDWNAVLAASAVSSFTDGPPAGTRVLDDGSTIDLAQVVNLARCQKIAGCTAADMNAVTGDRPWGPNNPQWSLFAYGRLRSLLPAGLIESPYYVVVMAGDDPGETDNDPSNDSAAGQPGGGVVALRAESFGPGGAHRVVEVTVSRAEGGPRLASWREVR
jgi:type IV pilus assembly PilX-like protein